MKSSTAANIPKVLTFLDLFQAKNMEELQVLEMERKSISDFITGSNWGKRRK